jgi:hypothetical protein
LVVISTPDLEAAYRIFSVLNNRGLDLAPIDIYQGTGIESILPGIVHEPPLLPTPLTPLAVCRSNPIPLKTLPHTNGAEKGHGRPGGHTRVRECGWRTDQLAINW